jgi:dienelactone hydrolase
MSSVGLVRFAAIAAVLVSTLGGCATSAQGPDESAASSDESEFSVRLGDKAMRVFVTRPSTMRTDTPVVIALHGISRGAEQTRAACSPLASSGWLILAPLFDKENFPSYNTSRETPERIASVFAEARRRYGLAATTFVLFGHSGGGQAAHRALMNNPLGPYSIVISANSGWYQLPQGAVPTCEAYARRMVLMLGDRDTRGNDLNVSARASAQGPHRLARGTSFFERARADSSEKQCPVFAWQQIIVPGVGHQTAGMVAAAMQLPVFTTSR